MILQVGALAAVAGAVIGLFRESGDAIWQSMLISGLTGALIGTGCSAVEDLAFSDPRRRFARRLPPVVLMIIRATAYSLIIVIGLAIPQLLIGRPLPWHNPDFGEVFAISALVALAFSTGTEIMRLLGREATLALLTGRYNRPRLENRVVIFADVIGSTALAERVGELRFHHFLQDVAQDLAEAVEMTRGDVHRYVGDAVIVTWPMRRGLDKAACLQCALRMHAMLAERAAFYRETYQAEAKLRVAIHCGQVAAGEIGDWKKEIALLGDTMNTTARIESAAKHFQASTVLSDEVVRRLPAENRGHLKRLPGYAAAGKQQELVLWTADDP